MKVPNYAILEDPKSNTKVIVLGRRRVAKLGKRGIIVVPEVLAQKLVGKYVIVKLIVENDVLEDV